MALMKAELEALVARLFRRYPALIGFSIQDASTVRATRCTAELDGDLCLVDVETFGAGPGATQLLGEIALPLLELIDKAPMTRDLMRGRTFARTFH